MMEKRVIQVKINLDHEKNIYVKISNQNNRKIIKPTKSAISKKEWQGFLLRKVYFGISRYYTKAWTNNWKAGGHKWTENKQSYTILLFIIMNIKVSDGEKTIKISKLNKNTRLHDLSNQIKVRSSLNNLSL